MSLLLKVQIIIYRLLLVADKPLACGDKTRIAPWGKKLRWARFGEYDLQPAIFCVCLQIQTRRFFSLFFSNSWSKNKANASRLCDSILLFLCISVPYLSLEPNFFFLFLKKYKSKRKLTPLVCVFILHLRRLLDQP